MSRNLKNSEKEKAFIFIELKYLQYYLIEICIEYILNFTKLCKFKKKDHRTNFYSNFSSTILLPFIYPSLLSKIYNSQPNRTNLISSLDHVRNKIDMRNVSEIIYEISLYYICFINNVNLIKIERLLYLLN